MAAFGRSELQEEFIVYVLELPAGDAPEEGVCQALALVVLKRRGGLLLCVPQGYFPEETLALGLTASAEDQIGQSLGTTIAAGTLEVLTSGDPPAAEEGATVDVLLVDVTGDMWDHLIPFSPSAHSFDVIHTFNEDRPNLFPMVDEVTLAVWNWISDPGSGERVAFYSAQEEPDPDSSGAPVIRRRAKAKAASGTADGEPQPKMEPKKSKPTVASLSATMEGISATIPQIMAELKALRERTDAFEDKPPALPSRPSALRQPLGDSVILGSATTPRRLASFVQEMPPPRSSLLRTPTKSPSVPLPISKETSFALAAELEDPN